jgi:hypothetical protein
VHISNEIHNMYEHIGYVWYRGEYIRITVTHCDFTKNYTL